MSRLHQLADLGQSIWYDYIRRSFITSGELKTLIDQGVRGVTSNPTIFEKAIAGSADYDETLKPLVDAGKSIEEIYETLAMEDIRMAADLMRPVYGQTDGIDGYVSLEVSPELAHDTEGTVKEARRLFATLNRPNIMIKVPASAAGIPAIRALIGAGIPVNVTLIFGLDHYKKVAEAYLQGLEDLAQHGGSLGQVASVASFFISRVDTWVDGALEKIAGAKPLQGKIAIAQAKAAYAAFRSYFSGQRWDALVAQGARPQRLLWASTSSKNPAYPDTLYVDELIGPNTVNTVPPATLTAFQDHGTVAPTLPVDIKEAKAQLETLAQAGIDLDQITQALQDQAVAGFATSFENLMASIAEKSKRLRSGKPDYAAELGTYEAQVQRGIKSLKTHDVMARIWRLDHTVWKNSPEEITNRLGWLRSPEVMRAHLPRLRRFATAVRNEGFTQVLLLGMGGSSLAPEVLGNVFDAKDGYLALDVLDSTDPAAVLAAEARHDPKHTLYLVSTKSGGTVETFSFFKYFYNRALAVLGEDKIGQHFVAITDPGSGLVETANKYKFRDVFLNDPHIGGRYSALSFFGLVPAALLGIDLEKLLGSALKMVCNCEPCNCPVAGNNLGAQGGVALGVLAQHGKDKLTLSGSKRMGWVGPWVEQLIAESLGKEGKGVLPVSGEPLGSPDVYGDDRFFVHLHLEGEPDDEAPLEALKRAGHPVAQVCLSDVDELGAELFRWEMATAVAGHVLRLNPFDQPNVEAAKTLARQMVNAYHEEGKLPALAPTLEENGIAVYADVKGHDLKDVVANFFAQAVAGDYIALQAYVQPTEATTEALEAWRVALRDRYRLATTLGYGPRFLHSTGQLHKGDGGNGLFVQLISDDARDVAIPDEAGKPDAALSFGVLKTAQALGDRQALLAAGRRVIRFRVGLDVAKAVKQLHGMLG